MQAPKRKTSKSRRNMRRAHDAITPTQLVKCEKCGELKFRHRVCSSCGTYRGRVTVEIPAQE